jgi:hypothetical protein
VSSSKKTVKEIRDELTERLPKDVSLPTGLKKKDLLYLLEMDMEELSGQMTLFIEEEIEMDNLIEEVEEEFSDEIDENIPDITSEEWTGYVLSLFSSDELIDGNPVTAGLRRVAEIVLGEIIESGPTKVFPATDEDGPGRATVVYRVVIRCVRTGDYKTYSDVADVWHGNTDDLFCAHPVATASTRAEGRALRKALKLKRVLAAEELTRKDVPSIVRQSIAGKHTDGEIHGSDYITVQQTNFIDTKCKQLDVSVMAYVNSGKNTYKSIDRISKETASGMIKELSRLQTETDSIPQGLSGYDPDWRNQ